MEVNVPGGGCKAAIGQKDDEMENSDYELIALKRVAHAAEELFDAIHACTETVIPGCNFEIEYTALQTALSGLPRYYERGRYLWKEIDEDLKNDAPRRLTKQSVSLVIRTTNNLPRSI